MLSNLIAMVDTPTEKEIIIQLYSIYKQFMYNISMSILGKREDAEDAVQDSFVRIIKNIDKIKNPYSRKTKSYITVITKNICYDIIRNTKNTEEFDDNKIPFEENYSEAKEKDVPYEQIIRNLKDLPPRLKSIAFLYFVQRLSPKDIGEMLDIGTNTVYTYISRIRKTLLTTKDNEYDQQ